MSHAVYLKITNNTKYELQLISHRAKYGHYKNKHKKLEKLEPGKVWTMHWKQNSVTHGVDAIAEFTILNAPWCADTTTIKFHVTCPIFDPNVFKVKSMPKPFYHTHKSNQSSGSPAKQKITINCSEFGVEHPTDLTIMSYNTHLAGNSEVTWPGIKTRLINEFLLIIRKNTSKTIKTTALLAIAALKCGLINPPMMKTFHDGSRRSNICKQILLMNKQPDVICFQEVWDDDYADEMIQNLKSAFPYSYKVPKSDRRTNDRIIKDMTYFFSQDYIVEYPVILAGLKLLSDIHKFLASSGLLVVSKYPISAENFKSFIYQGKYYKWKEDVCASKGVAYFDIALNAGKSPDKVHMLTTHAATGALYPANRLKEVFKDTNLIKPLAKDHKNIFFCGDFNIHRFKDPDPPEEASWYQSIKPQVGGRLINYVIEGKIFGKYGLSDLFKQQTNPDECYTAGGEKDTLMTHFAKDKEVQPVETIDFHFSNMKIKAPGQVIRDWTFTRNKKSYSLSDHFPVISQVKVNY